MMPILGELIDLGNLESERRLKYEGKHSRIMNDAELALHEKAVKGMMSIYMGLKKVEGKNNPCSKSAKAFEENYSIARDEAVRLGFNVSSFPKNVIGRQFN